MQNEQFNYMWGPGAGRVLLCNFDIWMSAIVAAVLTTLDISRHHTAAAAFVLLLVTSCAALVLMLIWVMGCACFDVG